MEIEKNPSKQVEGFSMLRLFEEELCVFFLFEKKKEFKTFQQQLIFKG